MGGGGRGSHRATRGNAGAGCPPGVPPPPAPTARAPAPTSAAGSRPAPVAARRRPAVDRRGPPSWSGSPSTPRRAAPVRPRNAPACRWRPTASSPAQRPRRPPARGDGTSSPPRSPWRCPNHQLPSRTRKARVPGSIRSPSFSTSRSRSQSLSSSSPSSLASRGGGSRPPSVAATLWRDAGSLLGVEVAQRPTYLPDRRIDRLQHLRRQGGHGRHLARSCARRPRV